MTRNAINGILWCGVILCLGGAFMAASHFDDPALTAFFSLPPVLVFWTIDALACGTLLIILAARYQRDRGTGDA